MRAAAPETTAAAIEVPVRATRPSPERPARALGAVERMSSPGAAMATWGPRAEIASGRPDLPSAPTASTCR